LEKQSRWRKEWSERFFVMDEDCIRYFVSPPAFLEDTAEESRGTLYLAGLVAEAAQDAGRPYCIRLGRDLLSCKTEPEQRRWLQAINAAAGAGDTQHTGREPVLQRKSSVSSADKEPNLFLVHPDGHHQVVSWRQPVSVHLAPSSCALMLILDASIENSSSASQALCRLPLSKYQPGTSASFPVEFLGGESMERLLRVQVLESSLLSYTEFLPLILGIVSVLSSVLWLWRLETSGLAVALLWNAWHWSQNPPGSRPWPRVSHHPYLTGCRYRNSTWHHPDWIQTHGSQMAGHMWRFQGLPCNSGNWYRHLPPVLVEVKV